MLFLDLTKAFDFAIREILLNFRQVFSKNKPERIALLEQLGLRRHDAETSLHELESEGSVLEQLVHDDGLVELIRSLHTNSWFKLGQSTSVIVSNRGGRQKCKLGGLIFNMIYAKALKALRAKLDRVHLMLRLLLNSNIPLWTPHSLGSAETSLTLHSVGEATFVDDECLMLCAKSPCDLDRKIDALLSLLIDEFGANGFHINFAKGKTEGIIVYRGKGAKHAKDKLWRPDPASGASVQLYPLPRRVEHHDYLHAVSMYKHVGTMVSHDVSWSADARLKAGNALGAYAPMART